MAPFKVIIVGGGLAGSLLACGLLRNNIDCVVYERDAEGSNREGYQIRLGANALHGFRDCLTPEQFEALIHKFGRSGGLISSAPILYNTKLQVLADMTKFPAYTKSAPINRVILRDFLQESVVKAGKLHYKKKLVNYEIISSPGRPDRVHVHFEDGTTDEGDILISAEGSASKVNVQVGLNNIVHINDVWQFNVKSELPMAKLRTLPEEVIKAPLSCINNGMIMFFSAYLPPPHTDKKGAEVFYDEDAAGIFLSFNVPDEKVPREGPNAIQDKVKFLIDQIPHWDPKYHDLIRAAGDHTFHVLQPKASKQPSKAWRREAKDPSDRSRGHSRVWLIGDAFHAMLPGRGMGGNQAMYDSGEALKSMKKLDDIAKASTSGVPDADVDVAVEAFEAEMSPRAFKWVGLSGGTGMKPKNPDSFTGLIALFFMARVLDLAYVYGIVIKAFGWKPTDDAPELPN